MVKLWSYNVIMQHDKDFLMQPAHSVTLMYKYKMAMYTESSKKYDNKMFKNQT